MKKNICILGSTGSIGQNTLDIIRKHPDQFRAQTLVTNKNIDLLEKQISEFKPEWVVIYNQEAFKCFKDRHNISDAQIWFGGEGIDRVFSDSKPDLLVNAFVGFAGLEPTIKAIKSKIHVALANKETLVVAGSLIIDLVEKNKIDLIPIDSEHSAIMQCLRGEEQNEIKRLILTASGGPFRKMKKKDLKQVTPEAALKHPNWEMGPKITIDSATLMNKGLEVIEAYWLYNVPRSSIEVVIHPQSIIHSMVEFKDNSIKAQLGLPDMRIPIQYALSYPSRFNLDIPSMDFAGQHSLTFEEPDLERFPCLNLAYETLKMGKTYPTVLNAANEEAVSAFLDHKIGFTDIPAVIIKLLDTHIPRSGDDFSDYLSIDLETRQYAKEYINKISRK